MSYKDEQFKLHYISGAELVGKYEFPMLQSVDYIPQTVDVFRTSDMKPRGKWCHFFVDDYRFNGLWNSFEKYIEQLSYYEGVITTDFSMYSDFPTAMQIWNCYRNRVLAYYMQARGLKIIPTVSWTDKSSFDWCFDGIPKGSNVAVSTNGCLSPENRRGYIQGMLALDEMVKPKRIIVVGKQIELDVKAELIYFESEYQKMERLKNGRKK